MADDVRPVAGDEQDVSSSGLLLSVDPLQGTEGYKLAGDDSSDTSDILGGDSDASDAGDKDKGGSGDADSSDSGSGDSDASDSDAAMNPLGLADSAGLDADASDDGPDSDATDAK